MGTDGYDIKVAVDFTAREGGGLRATSPDVPGLFLSSSDADALIADVAVAIEHILKINHGMDVEMRPLVRVRDILEQQGVIPRRDMITPTAVEFAGRQRAA